VNPTIENAAHAYLAPKIARNFKMRYLVYGAAIYYGLRFLRSRGILANQADFALNIIDRGINSVKHAVLPQQPISNY
jgi:hypothetical protein